MSDRYVEKTFLYLLALSVLLHAAIFGLITILPTDKEKKGQEPTMVDLTDLPEPPPAPPGVKPEQKRLAERPQRVTKEMAPKGTRETERLPELPARPAPQARSFLPTRPSLSTRPAPPKVETGPETPSSTGQVPVARPKTVEPPISRGEGLFKPKAPATGGAERENLFPSAGKLARLEESYRKKYDAEVQEGDTKFLNTDDIQFGSFLRRFENAVYGVWHYPEAALARGVEGVTPVKITFDRSGEITKVVLLESSGSRILDDEVMRTLKAIGPVGSFPKNYSGKEFNLIAFFQYGIGGGRLH